MDVNLYWNDMVWEGDLDFDSNGTNYLIPENYFIGQ